MFSFQKEERLKSRKVIGQLFQKGHSFTSFPIRFIWVKMDAPLSDFPFQMSLSVPKRKFPSAVDRNRLRRRIREAYRLNKNTLYEKFENQDVQFGLMLIYVAKEAMTYQEIENGIQKGFKKLAQQIEDSQR